MQSNIKTYKHFDTDTLLDWLASDREKARQGNEQHRIEADAIFSILSERKGVDPQALELANRGCAFYHNS